MTSVTFAAWRVLAIQIKRRLFLAAAAVAAASQAASLNGNAMAIDIDQSHYNTGTATIEANGTAVTGQGTTWEGAVRKGDLFGTHKGSGIRILSVNSNTSITLAYPWLGGAQTAAAYEIQRTPYDVGYLAAIEDMIRLYGVGNLPSLAGLDGTGGDKGVMLTGVGTADTFDLGDLATSVDASLTGSLRMATGGKDITITGAETPLVPDRAFFHILNPDVRDFTLRVTSEWTGQAGDPFVNNDSVLSEVYTNVLSSTSNQSWAGSFANAYHKIPVGVTDSGSRVGVLGWAVSVNSKGYTHAGVLGSQTGVLGRAGFQGGGAFVSPPGAVINQAIGVQGEVLTDSPGTTILTAQAGRFISETAGRIGTNIGVYGKASGGTGSNFSFYGAGGDFYNANGGSFGGPLNIVGAISQSGVNLKTIKNITFGASSTEYTTTSTTHQPTAGISVTALSTTSSLLVICVAQLETERSTVGSAGMGFRMFRYTGTAFAAMDNTQNLEFLRFAATGATPDINRASVTQFGNMTAAQKRTDAPTQWNVNPHVLSNYAGCTAKLKNHNMIFVEYEP